MEKDVNDEIRIWDTTLKWIMGEERFHKFWVQFSPARDEYQKRNFKDVVDFSHHLVIIKNPKKMAGILEENF